MPPTSEPFLPLYAYLSAIVTPVNSRLNLSNSTSSPSPNLASFAHRASLL
jgi:hypothetical protein